MSSIKNIILAIVVIVVFGIQGAYLMTAYRTEQDTIAQNKEEIRLTELRIAELEKRVENLPETEKELELVTAQKQAILNMLPPHTSTAQSTVELFRYMDINDFGDLGCVATDKGEMDEYDDIKANSYELSFVGRYEEVVEFVNNLNQSYQVINVKSLDMSNEVQNLSDKENLVFQAYYKEDFPKIVRATINITLYSRYDEETEEKEIYQPDLELRSNAGSLFEFTQKDDVQGAVSDTEGAENVTDIQEEPISTTPKVETAPIINTDDTFTLSVGDRITSGDTYKLDGPGSELGDYIGLISNTNVEITIEVYKDHYKMTMVDDNNEKESTEVKIAITNPRMNIISTMRALDDVMPNVRVYIHNHTDKVMEVALTGTLLENINVFNGQGQRVAKGETKGNIKLS